MRAAVVGHVEWVDFARVERMPRSGEIVHALETWAEPAGGGAVAAVQLAKLAGGATFFTAVGADELGSRARAGLEQLGLRVETAVRDEPQRRAFCFVEVSGERTITLLSRKLRPHADDPLRWTSLAAVDAVYFTGGDVGALRASRQARVLVATARELETLVDGGVQLDSLVRSGTDEEERYEPGLIQPPPRLVVTTAGASGGTYETLGSTPQRFEPAPLPGPIVDAYGAGDSFAAGLAFALADGRTAEAAVAFAARCGAAALTGRGAFAGQLRL